MSQLIFLPCLSCEQTLSMLSAPSPRHPNKVRTLVSLIKSHREELQLVLFGSHDCFLDQTLLTTGKDTVIGQTWVMWSLIGLFFQKVHGKPCKAENYCYHSPSLWTIKKDNYNNNVGRSDILWFTMSECDCVYCIKQYSKYDQMFERAEKLCS